MFPVFLLGQDYKTASDIIAKKADREAFRSPYHNIWWSYKGVGTRKIAYNILRRVKLIWRRENPDNREEH